MNPWKPNITPTGPWRTGRSVGRTIYVMRGDEASKSDELIGVMDSPQLAALVVLAVNLYLDAEKETP